MASNDDMTLAVHERRSRHYVTEGRGHSRFYPAVLSRVENHRKVAPVHESHQPLKVVSKIKKLRLIIRKIRYSYSQLEGLPEATQLAQLLNCKYFYMTGGKFVTLGGKESNACSAPISLCETPTKLAQCCPNCDHMWKTQDVDHMLAKC